MDADRTPQRHRRAATGGEPRDGGAFELDIKYLSGILAEQAQRVLAHPSRTEDVVQEALLRMWLHQDRFDPGRGSMQAWAAAIAHHVAVDTVRREAAWRQRDTLYFAGSAQVLHDEVAEAAERRFDAHRLRTAVNALPGAQREAVTLVYFRGLDIAETAAQLGVRAATVRSRLRDARASLRRSLGRR